MVCLCMLCSCAVCIYINFTDIIIRQMATQQFMCIKQKKYLQQTNVEQIDMHELRIRLSGCKNNKNNNIFSLSISNTHTHTLTHPYGTSGPNICPVLSKSSACVEAIALSPVKPF